MNISKRTFLLTVIAGLATALPALSLPTETFYFTGACNDCYNGDGNGTGTLTLTGNYVQGTSITADFVSFHYNGTDLQSSFTIAAGAGGLNVSGIIPVDLPSTANVSVSDYDFYFDSFTSGEWQLGPNNEGDFGFTSSWAGATVPEPMALELTGLGLACVALFRRVRSARTRP